MNYHIDTDMGVDDGLALVFAKHLLGDKLTAISTVFGNVPVDIATRNARVFRRLLGYAFPIFAGAARASDGFVRHASDVHGIDGLGGATKDLPAHFLHDIRNDPDAISIGLVGDVARAAGTTVIIGLGPATNIPGLVAHYGAANIEQIVLMSGVVFDVGNITPFAEFNAYCDPDALRETLGLGIPVTLIPLDVCRKVQLARQTVLSYLKQNPAQLTRLVVNSHMAYMDFYRESEGIDGCFPHDTLAVFAAIKPEWFSLIPAYVVVETAGDSRGRTLIRQNDLSSVSVAMGGSLKYTRELLMQWPIKP